MKMWLKKILILLLVVVSFGVVSCSNESKQEIANCGNHQFKEVENIDPTKTKPGLKLWKCKDCLTTKQEFYSPTGSVSKFGYNLESYALINARRAREQSKELFELAIKENQKEQFMFPISGLPTFIEIQDFTLELIKDCKTDQEKVVKIYEWIVTNIAYDPEYIYSTIYQVFQDKRAVCYGYVSLLHDMLSAANIMSVYVSGYYDYKELSVNDVLFYKRDLSNSHAWLYLYCDEEVVFVDPTHGIFDIEDYVIAKDYIAYDTNEINVIPEEIDCRLYDLSIYKLGDHIFYLQNGKISDFDGAYIIRNEVTEIDYLFRDENSAYVCDKAIPEHAAYAGTCAIATDFSNLVFAYYCTVDGHAYSYVEMLSYLNLLNQKFNKNISIRYQDKFIIKDNMIYLKVGFDSAKFAYSYSMDKEQTIPNMIEDRKVTTVCGNAFAQNEVVERINIQEGVKKIEDWAFIKTTNLDEVVMPNSIEELGNAFIYSGIKTITFPDNIQTVYGFVGCKDLEVINLPKNLITIEENFLYDCDKIKEINLSNENPHYQTIDGNLYDSTGTILYLYARGNEREKVVIPEGVTTISSSAFNGSNNLKEIVLPGTLEIIEDNAFLGCESLEKIVINEGVKVLGDNAISFCAKLKEVVLPSTLEVIGNNFQECIRLTSIYIPENVKEIGPQAFINTISLQEFVIDEKNPYFKVVDGVIYSKDGTSLIKYPTGKSDETYQVLEGTKVIESGAFNYTYFLEEVILNEGLTTIKNQAFWLNGYLYRVEIPESLEILEENAFFDNYEIKLYFRCEEKESTENFVIPYHLPIYWIDEWENN